MPFDRLLAAGAELGLGPNLSKRAPASQSVETASLTPDDSNTTEDVLEVLETVHAAAGLQALTSAAVGTPEEVSTQEPPLQSSGAAVEPQVTQEPVSQCEAEDRIPTAEEPLNTDDAVEGTTPDDTANPDSTPNPDGDAAVEGFSIPLDTQEPSMQNADAVLEVEAP